MKSRSLLAGLVAVATAAGALWLSQALVHRETEQLARIAEAESWAARSQLVRNIDTQLRAYRGLADFWSASGRLPREQWTSDAGIELDHFPGVEMILWSDREEDVRFYATSANFVSDYRPTAEEWESAAFLWTLVDDVEGEEMIGPELRDGRPFFAVHVGSQNGNLAALADARVSLENLLSDESAGYAITVHWNDIELYRRGEAAERIPESWTRTGLIETSMGSLWRVTHAPTEELAKALRGNLHSAVLLAGLAIAGLLALLVLENGRARDRALAAEAAKARLADLNRELEDIVKQRTADIETIQASVAHDLRNALNTVRIELARAQRSPEAAAPLDRLSDWIDRMATIVDRLVVLSTASLARFQPAPVDVGALAREVFTELLEESRSDGPELEVGALPEVQADATMTRILLRNLLDNSLKYTRDLEKHRLELHADEADGSVVFRLRDNGRGFEEGDAERLFEPFERLHEDEGVPPGLGLGLTIARRMVLRHGGQIWAEREEGQGATFAFSLCAPTRARVEATDSHRNPSS